MTPARFRLSVLLAATLGLAACSKPSPDAAKVQPGPPSSAAGSSGTVTLETVEQRASYGIGYDVGMNVAARSGLEVDQKALTAGLADAFSRTESRITQAEMQQAFATLQERMSQVTAAAAETNLKASTAFMEANKSKAGIQTTASGLQYEIISSGSGAKPAPNNTVEVHYHGTLVDGTVFDSSVQRGETIEFPVTRVIPGWVEALQLMSVGDKWRLFIPPALGYGANAAGKIPPNSALIFEVDLIGIK